MPSFPREDLLAQLPPTCVAMLQPALSAPGDPPDDVLEKVLKATAFPETQPGGGRVFPLAMALNPAQRALAELLPYDLERNRTTHLARNKRLSRFALPATAANRRHWLGLDPPNELDRNVALSRGSGREVPLWQALQIEGGSVLAEVPVDLAARAYGCLWRYPDIKPWYGGFLDTARLGWAAFDQIHPRLKDETSPWIAEYAKAALAEPTYTLEAAWLIFIGLVRSRIPLDPQWDRFFPIQGKARLGLTLECLEALPEERREGAVLQCLRNWGPENLSVALELRARIAGQGLSSWIRSNADQHPDLSKKEVLAALARVEEGGPLELGVTPALVGRKKKTSKKE